MTQSTQKKGIRGENIACEFLQKRGYRIIARNWRCKWGEIDIVAEIGGAIAFVEVKSATSARFGDPSEWVNRRKQKKMILAAKQYILDNSLNNTIFRFDIVAVDLRRNRVNHIPNAFMCEEE